MTLLGTPVPRVEDARLLTGAGAFVANVPIEGVLCVGYVTSTVAHGRLTGVDVEDARRMPGIVDVLTAAEVPFDDQAPLFGFVDQAMTRPLLAHDVVRFVGEPIAAVVGESAAAVADAIERVVVDIEPLPAVVRPEASEEVASRSSGGAEEPLPFDDCEVVVTRTIRNQRVAPVPIETRVAAAEWVDGRIVFHASCQGAHPVRAQLTQLYGLEPSQVRVITRDVGGSFGSKARLYPEELLLPLLSQRAGRPVRWVPTRRDDMVGLGHSRAQVQTITIGGDRDGTIRCLDAEIVADCGAHPLVAPFMVTNTGALLAGPYHIPHVRWSSRAVRTNTTPVVAYRGAGRPEAGALCDRAVDLFAREVGLDPIEVRRRNLLTDADMPWTSPCGPTYDSGDHAATFEAVLRSVDLDGLRAEQGRRRDAGEAVQLGIGTSVFVDRTGGAPGAELGIVQLRPDGSVLALTGSSPYGQGHHTTWAMLISDRTGIPFERIEVVHGDTDVIPRGGMTGGSRSVQNAGQAMASAADALVGAARVHAADLLEAAAGDVVLDVASGRFHVAGAPAAASVGWADVAVAVGEGDALRCESTFEGGPQTFPFGAYVAVVEVDVETGVARVVRMVTVDDAGTIVNPLLALGQVHGGIGQGIAQALFEEVVYDEGGNPLTSTLADYAVPTAADLPSYECALQETPSPHNPLGAKGIAESGTIGAVPAVQNAVVDALAHLGVTHVDLPCTPERVWRAINEAARR